MAEPAAQRLFFGLWPDQRTRRALARVAAQSSAHRGRAQHPEDLHITLVFLGQVTAEQQPCVIDAGDRLKGRPFQLSIDRLAYWKRPRILWCGPSFAPAALLELVSGLQSHLRACGFEPEKRAYSPHVTLLRKASPVADCALPEPLSWAVDELVLAASHSGVKAPRYRVLKKWSLGS